MKDGSGQGYYRTAAFAQLAGMNKKTLQYYDEIGLFRPARVEENGYRYYSIFQLDRLALIAALKDLGLPLKEIKRYLDSGDLALMDQLLDQQSRELARRLAQLNARKAMLERVRRENRDFLQYCGQGPQRLCQEADRLAVLLTDAEMRSHKLVIMNYLTDGPGTGMCSEGEESFIYQRRADGPIPMPGGEYLCLFEASDQPLRLWMAGARKTLEEYAGAHGLALEGKSYAEFNELSVNPQKPQTEGLRVLRVRILE